MCKKLSQIVPKLYLSLFYRNIWRKFTCWNLCDLFISKLGDRLIEVKMTQRGKQNFRNFKNWPLNTGWPLIRCCLTQFDCTFLSVIHQQAELLLRWFPVQDCFYLNPTSVIHNLFIICWARDKRGRPKMSYYRLYSQTVLSFESNWN